MEVQKQYQSVDRQVYRLYTDKRRVMSIRETLEEFLSPASRFRSPLPYFVEKRLWLEERLLAYGVTGRRGMFFESREYLLPLQWKKILDFLCRIGIMRTTDAFYDQLFNDEPKLYCLRLWSSSIDGKTDGRTDISDWYSRGVSQDPEEAVSKVVGELLERYPLTLYHNQDLRVASVGTLRRERKKFLDPFLVDQFSEWQKERFPRYRFDEKSLFRWVEGVSLMTGKKALIPAQMVFWNYKVSEKEPIVQIPSTNGAGGMFTLEEAILSGLYELVQRDAFLVYWLNGIAPPRIDPVSIRNEDIRKLLDSCDRYGIDVHILDVTSDLGIPAVIVVLADRFGGGPAVTLGGGCGPSIEKNILRALTEAVGIRSWLRVRMEGGEAYHLPERYIPFGNKELTITNRVLYWGNPGMRKKIDFFLTGPSRSVDTIVSPFDIHWSPEKELAFIREKFQKMGRRFEIFYYAAKHPALDRLGYSSVHVCVPGILEFYLNETGAPLGNKRWQDVARAMGHTPAEEPNPIPHPFP